MREKEKQTCKRWQLIPKNKAKKIYLTERKFFLAWSFDFNFILFVKLNKRKDSTFKFLITVIVESVAVSLAVLGSILAGAITGWLIEEKLLHGKTSPWITTIFIIFGAIGGIKNLLYYTKRKFREKEDGKS